MAQKEIVLPAQAVVYRAGGTQRCVTQSRRYDQIEIFPRLNQRIHHFQRGGLSTPDDVQASFQPWRGPRIAGLRPEDENWRGSLLLRRIHVECRSINHQIATNIRKRNRRVRRFRMKNVRISLVDSHYADLDYIL